MPIYISFRDLEPYALRRFISGTPDRIDERLHVKSAEDYTDEDLLQRLINVVESNNERLWVPPILSRVELLYAHLVEKALYISKRIALRADVSDAESIRRLKFKICKHILELDSASAHHRATLYKCVDPTGANLTAAVTRLLQGTVYHRYRFYVSRRLTTLEFSNDPFLIKYWREVSFLLHWERAKTSSESGSEDPEQRHSVAQMPMFEALKKVATILDVDPRWIGDAIRAFIHHLRSAARAASPRFWSVLRRSVEIELLCLDGNHQKLARMLHRDYWTMNKMLRVVASDDEIVHLQTVILQMVTHFFDQKARIEGKEDMCRSWRPRNLFWLHKWLLENGSGRLPRNTVWAFRAKAEQAEDIFREAWKVFNDVKSTYSGPAGWLLTQYLKSLGVKSNDTIDGEELAHRLVALTTEEHTTVPELPPNIVQEHDLSGENARNTENGKDENKTEDKDEDGSGYDGDESASDENDEAGSYYHIFSKLNISDRTSTQSLREE